LVVGSGSDLSEEPAVQDVEPVTLESESLLFCPPGPTCSQLVAARWASMLRCR